MKFKAGDKVKMKRNCSGTIKNYIYELKKSNSRGELKEILFAWKGVNNADADEGCFCESYWELITSSKQKTIMTKLNQMMKKLLDADTRKLIKSGFINGDLEFTDEGKEALYAILLEKFKPELLVMAEEQIKEDKEK